MIGLDERLIPAYTIYIPPHQVLRGMGDVMSNQTKDEDVTAPEAKSGGFSHQKWWDEHGEGVREKRRDKYATDPDHRERVKARSRDYQRRRAAERKDAQGRRPQGTRIRRPRKPKLVSIGGGESVKMYTVGTLARTVGKTTQTIAAWERRNFIPDTPFRCNGVRLYSEGMILVVKGALDEVGTVRFGDDQVFMLVERRWATLGVNPKVNYEVLEEAA